ncbi:hypothetical protein CAOG_04120 [Capsaspora owczarzaki ATCC 30864]|uniref:Uncharacterized protein n=1 Tax=Capsaspora owczarzaki (strain ATCC 30864) TaxID=595528 RepID=A0A0D2X2X4_CAPO3|nr:hypothetical protein CAOG_04120 [Capsaspora owczarzaki ATCC 30864]KJE93314.1 hypothetical protein CAOG_004120 [Capsaspora owczarzaki ATCC 30864]|eukprot:XP_004347945.1 hypothetical protein CAOG_04120 [Capsaspora owczarzaki ATCC 30864]
MLAIAAASSVAVWYSNAASDHPAPAGSDTAAAALPPPTMTHSINTKTPVAAVRWSPSSQVLAVATESGDIHLSLASSADLGTLSTAQKLSTMDFSPNSKLIAEAGASRVVTLWDVKTQRVSKQLQGHNSSILAVRFAPVDGLIASASASGDILVHSAVTSQLTSSFTRPMAVRSLDFSLSRRGLLACAGDDGAVTLFDVIQNATSASFASHIAPAIGVAFSPTAAHILASVGLDKRLSLFNVNEKRATLQLHAEEPLTGITFHPDKPLVAIGTQSGAVHLVDLRRASDDRGNLLPLVSVHAPASVTSVAFARAASQDASSSSSTVRSQQPASNSKPAPTQTSSSLLKSTLDPRGSREVASTVFSPLRGPQGDTRMAAHSPVAPQTSSAAPQSIIFSPLAPPAAAAASSSAASRVTSAVPSTARSSSVRPESHGTVDPVVRSASHPSAVFSPLASAAPDSRHFPTTRDLHHLQRSVPPSASSTVNTSHLAHTGRVQHTPADMRNNVTFTTPDPVGAAGLARGATLAPAAVTKAAQQPTREATTAAGIPAGGAVAQPQQRSISNPERLPSVPLTLPAVAALPAAQSQQPIETLLTMEIQAQLIRSTVEEAMDGLRLTMHREIQNMHLELLRQFQIQRNELETLIQTNSVNESLLREIDRLKRENERLRQAQL